MKRLNALYHRSNALGAENFMDLMTPQHNRYFLQIGMKCPIRCTQRMTPVMTKSRYFPAVFALSHFRILSRNKLHGINPAKIHCVISKETFYHKPT